MRYKQSATAPEWFKSDNLKLYASATSGSSPSNEWYEFDDRCEAIWDSGMTFKSESFMDGFCWFEGEIYDFDQFTPESMQAADDPEGYVLKEGAEVASLDEIVQAESRF